MMIQPTYEEAGDFYKNLAVVKLEGKYGVVNKQGRMMLKNEFDTVHNLSNNKRRLVSSTRTIEITDKGVIKQVD
ncbi:MAG: WG repeat-containing protein, partial [Opitutaceae bacterium]|nr:WG repeat-containing protein [Cytophagales bacterium]